MQANDIDQHLRATWSNQRHCINSPISFVYINHSGREGQDFRSSDLWPFSLWLNRFSLLIQQIQF